jgi:hypothetical protein
MPMLALLLREARTKNKQGFLSYSQTFLLTSLKVPCLEAKRGAITINLKAVFRFLRDILNIDPELYVC